MILGILYSLQHFFSLLIYDKKLKRLFIFFSIAFFFIIYLLKSDTYDILNYVASVDYPYYEPLFSLIIVMLRPFMSNRSVILVIQFLISFLTYLVINLYIKKYNNKVDKRISFIFAFFSVAFTLGVNNGLRQYMASLIVFISLWFFLNNKIILSLLVFCFAPFIHLSSSMFYFLIIVILLFSKRVYFARGKLTLSFSLFNSLFFFIFFNSLNELASRVLSFYFTLEMIVLSLAYVKGYKTGAIIINLSYAFAINAINVIGRI